MSQSVDGYVNDISNCIKKMISTDIRGNVLCNDEALEFFVGRTQEIKDRSGIFFFAGNGASASMAEHFSHDCFQNADLLTMTVSETTHMTAIANDISFECIFSYRISKALTSKDALVAISSSGNSRNIIKAIDAARDKGMFVATFSGMKSDNASRRLGDINFYVPAETYGAVESAHAILLHCWLDLYLDKYMNGRH
jgi:D-sedoheptulose 7-phosphate isomerase